MNRLFNWRQRKILQIIAGNMCQKCGEPFAGGFHADHKTSWANGGMTITKNGQALCVMCNLQKGKRDA